MWVLGEWNLYCNNELIDTVTFEGVEHIQDGIFNPYYLLVERSYTNLESHGDCKYRQTQQWEFPEFEDWYEDPRPIT